MSATLNYLVYSKVKYAKVLNSTGLDKYGLLYSYKGVSLPYWKHLVHEQCSREVNKAQGQKQNNTVDQLCCLGLAAPIVFPLLADADPIA